MPRVTPLAPSDRPREKLAANGAASLGDNELLAIVLGEGARGTSALDLANAVFARFGGAVGLTRAGYESLRRVAGVGPAKAAQMLAAVELGRRTLLHGPARRAAFASPRELAAYLIPRFSARAVEHFGIVLLDVRQRLLRSVTLTVGTLDCSVVHPRDVFREALDGGAATVVMFHNHPSGDPTPSTDDARLTWRMVEAGELLGIEVLDHLVLADASYYSFRERGRLRAP
jgi:DNA repair protein RadC